MPDLPAHPDFRQLRRQARDLLRAARGGEPTAVARVVAVSERVTLASAQLAIAREYGFPSWAKLKAEVERREIFDDADLSRLTRLLEQRPGLAVREMTRWRDHPLGAAPLNYVAMLRYDTSRAVWRDVPGTAATARALLAAGAAVNGSAEDLETPLITAASYGDAAVAAVLVEAGADLEATASPRAGGVPCGTALLHAAVFGMTSVVDVLVAAGAHVPDLVVGAAAGDVSRWPLADVGLSHRVLALVMAADHQRLHVVDELVAAGTPVDAVDQTWGRHPLRLAAGNGRPRSVRRLLHHGADPNLRDREAQRPLDLALAGQRGHPDAEAYDEVVAVLRTVTD